MWMELLMALIGEAPALIADGEELVTGILHGEGGLAKVEKISAGLAHLTASVNAAVSAHTKA